jgi:hypothetical protein
LAISVSYARQRKRLKTVRDAIDNGAVTDKLVDA